MLRYKIKYKIFELKMKSIIILLLVLYVESKFLKNRCLVGNNKYKGLSVGERNGGQMNSVGFNNGNNNGDNKGYNNGNYNGNNVGNNNANDNGHNIGNNNANRNGNNVGNFNGNNNGYNIGDDNANDNGNNVGDYNGNNNGHNRGDRNGNENGSNKGNHNGVKAHSFLNNSVNISNSFLPGLKNETFKINNTFIRK